MGSIPSILSHGVGQNVSRTKMVQNKNVHLMSSVCVCMIFLFKNVNINGIYVAKLWETCKRKMLLISKICWFYEFWFTLRISRKDDGNKNTCKGRMCYRTRHFFIFCSKSKRYRGQFCENNSSPHFFTYWSFRCTR